MQQTPYTVWRLLKEWRFLALIDLIDCDTPTINTPWKPAAFSLRRDPMCHFWHIWRRYGKKDFCSKLSEAQRTFEIFSKIQLQVSKNLYQKWKLSNFAKNFYRLSMFWPTCKIPFESSSKVLFESKIIYDHILKSQCSPLEPHIQWIAFA